MIIPWMFRIHVRSQYGYISVQFIHFVGQSSLIAEGLPHFFAFTLGFEWYNVDAKPCSVMMLTW
jgi:hypothetical protein